jgi:hypothetical protein
MSRHRIKDVSYDDEDLYDDDDDYDSPDPAEQEFVQQCTVEVLQQLRAGDPSVTATKEEVQESLWHYYNDVQKTVNYLRGMVVFFFMDLDVWVVRGDGVFVFIAAIGRARANHACGIREEGQGD